MTISNIIALISTGTPKYIFDCGDYSGLIVENLSSTGPMEYRFALTIKFKEEKELFIITAEFNSMDILLLNEVPGRVQDQVTTKKYYLCGYDYNEHINYGQIDGLDDIKVFISKSFDILKDRFGVSCDVNLREIHNNIKEIQALFDRISGLDFNTDHEEILDILSKIEALDSSGKFIEHIKQLRSVLHRHTEISKMEGNVKYDVDGCITYIFLVFAIFGLMALFFKIID